MSDFTNIKIIGFDLDQTLYPKSLEIDRAIQKHIKNEISKFKGISFKDASNIFDKDYPSLSARKILMKLGFKEFRAIEITQEALETDEIEKYLNPNEMIISFLKELKSKYILGLITGSSENVSTNKLNKLKISKKIFDFLCFGDVSKRDGSAYKKWIEHYPNFKPENFLYVGDRKETDVFIPMDLGIKAVLVNVLKVDDSLNVYQFKSLMDLRKLLH